MNKAFVRESGDEDEDGDDASQASTLNMPGAKNYMTPQGHARLRSELFDLIDVERPKVVDLVSWAASNGDRSENGDYLYGKKRLREIDRRIRFLTKRLEIAEVVDPSLHHGTSVVFFGATVTCEDEQGERFSVTILGIDEANSRQAEVSWVSPIAKALIKSALGDVVRLNTPSGWRELEVVAVSYPAPDPKARDGVQNARHVRSIPKTG